VAVGFGFVVAVVGVAVSTSPAAGVGVAGSSGEIRLEVTQRPPKLVSAEELPRYFAGALRASYQGEDAGAIKVAFRAALVQGAREVVSECASRELEIAPGAAVGAEALARGFEKCFVPRGEDGAVRLQVVDLGSAPAAVFPDIGGGFWNPDLDRWACRKVEDPAFIVAIALLATDPQTAANVASAPHIFALKYPIEHGV
jgi:hypothetical protein